MDEACVMSDERTTTANPHKGENLASDAAGEKEDAPVGIDRSIEACERDRDDVGEAAGAKAIPADIDSKEEGSSSSETKRHELFTIEQPSEGAVLRSEIYPHQCSGCAMAFKTEERLRQHRLSHSAFVLEQKCRRGGGGEVAKCEKSFASPTALREHLAREHTAEGGGEEHKSNTDHHSTSTEQELINEQLMSLLLRQPHSSTFLPYMQSLDSLGSKSAGGQPSKKPYRCNVCRLSYAISSTLDTHLRSFAHQSRMQRLQELVERGEVNAQKPVSEQPGGIPQKLIAELIDADGGAKQASVLADSLFFNNDAEEPTDLSIRRDRPREPTAAMRMGKSTPTKPCSAKGKHGHAGLNYTPQPSKRGSADALTKSSPFASVFDQQQASYQVASQNPLFTSFMTQMAMAQMAALQQQQLLQSSEHTTVAAVDGNKNLLQKKIMEAAMGGMGLAGQYSPLMFNPFLAANSFAGVFNPLAQSPEVATNSAAPSCENGDSGGPKAKRPKNDQQRTSANTNNHKAKKAAEAALSAANQEDLMRSQLVSLMGVASGTTQSSQSFAPQGVDFTAMLAAFNNSASAAHTSNSNSNNNSSAVSRIDGDESPQQKRARTRITDEQLKVLRQYFDINNSPSEEHIREMSQKAQLPEKVIKHWFRNTLFKERQRDKDSPYNFSVPPQLTIDLATYEKTGEAKVTPLKIEPGYVANAAGRETTPDHKSASPTKPTPSPTASRSPSISSSTRGQVDRPLTTTISRTVKQEREDEDETSLEHSPSPNAPPLANLDDKVVAAGTADEKSPFLEQWQKLMAATTMMAGFSSMSPTVPAAFNPAMFFGGGAMAVGAGGGHSASNSNSDNRQQQQPDLSALLASSTSAPPPSSSVASSPLLNNFLSTMVRQQQKGSLAQSTGTSSSSRNTPQPGSLSASPPQQPKAATSVPPQPPSSMSSPTSVLGGGRRANRTRFTDYQLKALQHFFDRQAYPKDDDLEMLSKKLGLSPRVIVVWFQNARQKARKIFENNPVAVSAAAVAAMATGSHPASAMAHLAHQQEQRHTNKSTTATAVEESLSEEEKNTPFANGKAESSTSTTTFAAIFGGHTGEGANGGGEGGSPAANLMALLSASGSLNFALNSCAATREEAQKGDEPTRQRSEPAVGTGFHKRCPFCTHAFHIRDALAAHIPRRHPEQGIGDKTLEFLIDTLPTCVNDDGANTTEHIEQKGEGSGADFGVQEQHPGNDDGYEEDDASPLDLSRPTEASHSPPPHSPRSSSNVHEGEEYEEEEEGEDNHSRDASIASECRLPPPSTRSSSLGPQRHVSGSLFQHHSYQHQRPGSRGSSKRYRTHLTPMQVFVMKCVFNDYKTPSMGECDSLGRQIGLHKRVVQVWFQNARAKMRKSRGDEEAEDLRALPSIGSTPNAPECELCAIDFASSGATMQEHLLSDTHINNIREHGASLRGAPGRAEAESHGEYDESVQNHREHADHVKSSNKEKSHENHDQSPNNEGSQSSPPSLVTDPFGANQFPSFNLPMLPSQVMLFGDPALYGTPIKLLQIPTTVQERITSELTSGGDACKFAQDGLQLPQLAKRISAHDFTATTTSESEVGWACRNCSNVFQQLSQLQNHQKLVCQTSAERPFRLIQIFYECTLCSSKFGAQRFGTQAEFRLHCATDAHQRAVGSPVNDDG